MNFYYLQKWWLTQKVDNVIYQLKFNEDIDSYRLFVDSGLDSFYCFGISKDWILDENKLKEIYQKRSSNFASSFY